MRRNMIQNKKSSSPLTYMVVFRDMVVSHSLDPAESLQSFIDCTTKSMAVCLVDSTGRVLMHSSHVTEEELKNVGNNSFIIPCS